MSLCCDWRSRSKASSKNRTKNSRENGHIERTKGPLRMWANLTNSATRARHRNSCTTSTALSGGSSATSHVTPNATIPCLFLPSTSPISTYSVHLPITEELVRTEKPLQSQLSPTQHLLGNLPLCPFHAQWLRPALARNYQFHFRSNGLRKSYRLQQNLVAFAWTSGFYKRPEIVRIGPRNQVRTAANDVVPVATVQRKWAHVDATGAVGAPDGKAKARDSPEFLSIGD